MSVFFWASEAAHAAGDHAEAGAHGAESGGFPPFDPVLFSHQLFWFAIAFGALFYLMSKKVLPNVADTLAKRANTIEADLAGARAAGEAAEAARAGHEKLLAEARAKARSAIDDVRAKSAAAVAAETQKSDVEVAQTISAAEAKISAMRTEALANVRTTAADLAVEIAQKIGGISVSKAEAEKAIDSARSAA